MSATNRGIERQENDFYSTPAWCVHRLLERLRLPGGMWLEPCVGEGAIVRAVSEVRHDLTWDVNDLVLRPHFDLGLSTLVDQVTEQNFLDYEGLNRNVNQYGKPYDVCITNPPYSLAEEFIEHALSLSTVVVMLLRLNFLGSAKRLPLFERVGIPSVYVLPNRPSFMGDGTTDATEYAWFVWDQLAEFSTVNVLSSTPKEIRCLR